MWRTNALLTAVGLLITAQAQAKTIGLAWDYDGPPTAFLLIINGERGQQHLTVEGQKQCGSYATTKADEFCAEIACPGEGVTNFLLLAGGVSEPSNALTAHIGPQCEWTPIEEYRAPAAAPPAFVAQAPQEASPGDPPAPQERMAQNPEQVSGNPTPNTPAEPDASPIQRAVPEEWFTLPVQPPTEPPTAVTEAEPEDTTQALETTVTQLREEIRTLQTTLQQLSTEQQRWTSRLRAFISPRYSEDSLNAQLLVAERLERFAENHARLVAKARERMAARRAAWEEQRARRREQRQAHTN